MRKSTFEVSRLYFVVLSVGCASRFGFTESTMFGLTKLTRFFSIQLFIKGTAVTVFNMDTVNKI